MKATIEEVNEELGLTRRPGFLLLPVTRSPETKIKRKRGGDGQQLAVTLLVTVVILGQLPLSFLVSVFEMLFIIWLCA